MNFLAVAKSDRGIVKEKNQDSLTVKVANTSFGQIVFAVICDGMGGLEQGEVASATVIHNFENWFANDLPILLKGGVTQDMIINQWSNMLATLNQKIGAYGKSNGIRLGTTITAMLFLGDKYYIAHVGDSRAYEICDGINVLTKDQTLVEMEVEKGIITPEQAKVDPRRSVLLQCIGASDVVVPDFYCGYIRQNATYMLCSDGFRHEITAEEMWNCFAPSVLTTKEAMSNNTEYLIELVKSRMERDNISVILIRTY